MRVQQDGSVWNVVDNGVVLATVGTNSEAWRWIERNERDPIWLKGKRANRSAVEREHYIGDVEGA
jgi:hypothetical protein